MRRKDRRKERALHRAVGANVPILGAGNKANGKQLPTSRIVMADGTPNLSEFERQVQRLQQVIDSAAGGLMRMGVPREAIVAMMKHPVARGFCYPVYTADGYLIKMVVPDQLAEQ